MTRWLASVDHKTIGIRYVVTALAFLILGGVLALVIRLQLARPDSHLVGPETYDQIFTTHGSTMMFLFAVPIMQGIGVYLVPLMIGTKNLAFPRLNAFGYWMYLVGGAFLWVSMLIHTAPDAGWFAYVPLSESTFAPTKGVDVWAQFITFTELSALSVATNIIVTIFKHRAPGITLARMPMFVWAQLVTNIMVIFAMPSIMLTTSMLASDRLIHTHYFDQGSDPLLWQHLFWYFAHPEVYIIFLPATGFVSTIIVAFSRSQLVGYTANVLSLAATAFIGFGVWVHHMFATGLPNIGESFFTASSLLIVIPSGVQFFIWIATVWRGSLRLEVPMLWVLAFVATFLIGGLTGVMIASVPINLQVHDTYFIVAHFHYVLIGGAVFPLFGAIYFWFPKVTGKLLGERLGRWSCGLVFAGFQLTFFPMHVLGLHGMPRRVYTYTRDSGWSSLSMLATIGAFVLGLGFLLTAINIVRTLRRGRVAGGDPWQADGLEWTTSSPPPEHNFSTLPTVRDRYAAWTSPPDQPRVVGLTGEEVLVTTLANAEPDHRHALAGPSLAPLFTAAAIGVLFISSIFTPWGVVIGAALSLPPLVWWFWANA